MTTTVMKKRAQNQCVIVSRYGGPDVLQVVAEEIPEPRAGEVRVKVRAAGVSAYDLMFRNPGLLTGTPRPPFVLGEDVVSVVDKLGSGVSSIELEQIVASGTFALGLGGGYAEFICLPTSQLVPVPPRVDPVVAARIPLVEAARAHELLERGGYAGKVVLITGT